MNYDEGDNEYQLTSADVDKLWEPTEIDMKVIEMHKMDATDMWDLLNRLYYDSNIYHEAGNTDKGYKYGDRANFVQNMIAIRN